MEAILRDAQAFPREAGTVVSHLPTLAKDLQKTSLPLPPGRYRLQNGMEKPLPKETRLPERADNKRKTRALLGTQAVIPDEEWCNGCKTPAFSKGTSVP